MGMGARMAATARALESSARTGTATFFPIAAGPRAMAASRLKLLSRTPTSATAHPAWIFNRSDGGLGLSVSEAVEPRTVLSLRPTCASDTAPWTRVEVTHCRTRGDSWTLGCQVLEPSTTEAVLA